MALWSKNAAPQPAGAALKEYNAAPNP